jgi:hypothetical protein
MEEYVTPRARLDAAMATCTPVFRPDRIAELMAKRDALLARAG